MKIYAAFMDNAYLLGIDGEVISVLNHPSADFEFESIVYVLSEYGNGMDKKLATEYTNHPTDELKAKLVAKYNDRWCKVRVWENGKLVTFRITSTNSYNWYGAIINFLIDHPGFKTSKITVESDKSTGVRKTYWNEISYADAISPEYETILATKL